MESKKIISEPLSDDEDEQNSMNTSKLHSDNTTMPVDEIRTFIKNQDQFCWLFGVEMNYFLPPKTFITWPYIIMVLTGEKKLIKNSEVKISHNVPTIKELKMNFI